MHLRIAAGWLTAVVLAGGTGRAHAQVNLRLNLGREAGASIRFGSEHHPPPVVRAVPPASVRYEHYREHERGRDHLGRPIWVAPPHVGHYRNPYNDVYFRRFRPGYRPVVVNGAQYYFYPTLPPGYQTVVVNQTPYYLSEGVYYQPYLYEGQTVFMAVPSPLP